VFLDAPQQTWIGESPEIMQVARFAGQEMMAIQKSDDEPDVFELHYLGLVGSGFQSMAEAKDSAPAFAKEVLQYLSQMITDTAD
jgi:hypothetical protein